MAFQVEATVAAAQGLNLNFRVSETVAQALPVSVSRWSNLPL